MCPTKSKASRSQATFHANMNLNKRDHFLKEKLNQGKGPDLTSSVKKIGSLNAQKKSAVTSLQMLLACTGRELTLPE